MERPEWIEVGRVVRPHGVRGEVRVAPDTDNPDRFRPGSLLFAQTRGADERIELEIDSVRGEETLPIVSFAGFESRERAAELRGAVLLVPASDLPVLDEGEYYPWELSGLEVRLPGGEVIGRVVELLDSPANDVLVVTTTEGGRILIPFVMEVVPEVDLKGGFVVVEAGVIPDELLFENEN